MAFSHRKLLPTQPEVNETKECSGFCDSSSTEISYCPQNCLLICSSICNTTNAFTHSPPSPLPVPSPGGRTNQTPHILPLVILIVVVFGGSFLIYIFYADIVKWYSNWKSSWRPPPLSENTHDDILEDNHGPVINHPIRFNTTGGLQESTIKSITACKYKRGAGLVEGTECSVCLNELKDDETLRLLPKCNHAFHLSCIDTWLRTHTTCPLCRSSVVSNTAGPPVTEMEPNSNNSATGNETLVENSGSDAQS